MGVRSNDHQLVAGKQYFQDDVQLGLGTNVLVQEVDCNTAAVKVPSGAMTIPAGSLITRLTAVVTSEITNGGANNHGIKFGTAADGTELTTLDADSLEASSTTVAAGVGVSTDALVTAGLGGTLALVPAAAWYFAAATDVHGTLLASASTYTAGTIKFIVEYVALGDNV